MGPICPSCKKSLEVTDDPAGDSLELYTKPAVGGGHWKQQLTLVLCPHCGAVLGVLSGE